MYFSRLQARINADVESFGFRFIERNDEDIESFRFIAAPTHTSIHTAQEGHSTFSSCWMRSRRNDNVRHVGAQDFTCVHPHIRPTVPILILGRSDLAS